MGTIMAVNTNSPEPSEERAARSHLQRPSKILELVRTVMERGKPED